MAWRFRGGDDAVTSCVFGAALVELEDSFDDGTLVSVETVQFSSAAEVSEDIGSELLVAAPTGIETVEEFFLGVDQDSGIWRSRIVETTSQAEFVFFNFSIGTKDHGFFLDAEGTIAAYMVDQEIAGCQVEATMGGSPAP